MDQLDTYTPRNNLDANKREYLAKQIYSKFGKVAGGSQLVSKHFLKDSHSKLFFFYGNHYLWCSISYVSIVQMLFQICYFAL